MNGVCRANKRDGSPCTAPATGADRYCWAHDPAHADQRRRMASKAGKSRANGEIASLKKQLKDLAADVLSGEVERGAAAVVNQIYNTLLRAIEQQRRERELEEIAARLEEVEEILQRRKDDNRWPA